MALHLETYNGSTWDTVNLTTSRVTDFKLTVGYSHPMTLTFVIYDDQQDTPIDPYTPIRFWDDAGSDPATSTAYSSSNPTFIGYVEDVDPGEDGQTIKYTCYDPTARASNQTPIMSTAWTSATAEGTGAVPRLVYNSTIDNDDDYVFCRAFDQEIGEIITDILDDALLRLRSFFAAPSASDAYVAADLTGMNYEPQEKMVFMSEPIRSGILRLINDWEPEWRLLFYPGTLKWRFGDITASSAVTRTLNDFTETHPILQFQLNRSTEDRYTAVKIYGPEALENRTIYQSAGDLNDISSTLPLLDTFGAGQEVRGRDKWQVDDSTKYRAGRFLPTAILVGEPQYQWAPNAWVQNRVWTRAPQFQVRYKNNTAGTDVWQSVTGWFYDSQTGIIDFKGNYVYRFNNNPEIEDSILQPEYENPEDVRFIYPSFIDPLSTRIPASGFEGSAYDDYDLENELKIYDESLAVGYEYGTAVTSATRLAKFAILARKILDTKKDVIHTGGVTFEGMDYEWALLDRKINLDGVDGDGSALTTGWESLGAIVTDVEYDYEQDVTTIQFSTDHSELVGEDPAFVKEQLKIGAAFIHRWIDVAVAVSKRRSFTEFGTPIIGADVTVAAAPRQVVLDPFFGTADPVLYNVGND